MKSKNLFIFLFLLAIPQSLFARPHSCRGRIQQYPCQYSAAQLTGMVEEDRDPALSYENSPRAGFRNRGVSKTSARILNASFTRTSPGRGLWKGHFIGEGYVQLYLDLLRDEDLIESRSMGSTEVSLEEGPISFSFESPLPPASALRHKKLSWKIRAQIAD